MAVSLRERRRQLLRDEILQAASALLNENGYTTLSMDELASRAGISKPTLYSHFTTKEDLIVAVILSWFDRIEAAVLSDPAPRRPLQQLTFVLRTVVRIQIEAGVLAPRPWAPEIFHLLRQRTEVFERLQKVAQAVADLVDAAIHSGEISQRLEPAMVVQAFFAISNSLNSPFGKLNQSCGIGTRFNKPADPAAMADTLAVIFENGVRAP